jgi:hypothetical protein
MSQSAEGLGLFIPKPYALDHALARVFAALGLEPPSGLL